LREIPKVKGLQFLHKSNFRRLCSSWEKYVDEKFTTDKLAKIYADHISDEDGNVLARIWESV